jgi:hypothetical protein
MTPTPEASERQRKAAHKAWETIRRKKAQDDSEAKPEFKAEAESQRKRARRKWNSTDYPPNWKEIGAEIRNRSRNENDEEQCECRGECLKHRGRCEKINGTWAKHRRNKGRVKIRFTIAHLCHTSKCDDRVASESYVRALPSDLRPALQTESYIGESALKWAIQQSQTADLGAKSENKT